MNIRWPHLAILSVLPRDVNFAGATSVRREVLGLSPTAVSVAWDWPFTSLVGGVHQRMLFFADGQGSAITSFYDKAFYSKPSICGKFLHMFVKFRHTHKEEAPNVHISKCTTYPWGAVQKGLSFMTVLYCSNRQRSFFNGSVMITPEGGRNKKKINNEVERVRDEAFVKGMADSGGRDIYVLKMQIRGPGLKFCMPMLSSKPPILLFQAHQFCPQILIETVKQQKWKHSTAHIYLKRHAA